MDVLPRITGQFFELFRSMSPVRRVASIAIALSIIVGFAALLISNGQATHRPVSFGKSFASGELDSAEKILRSKGVTDVRRDGPQLLVPVQDLDRSNTALLEADALPNDLGSQMLKQFESLGPFSTDRQRQQMKEALLLQELRNTIKGIPGIEDARVAIAHSDRRHGWNQKPRTTANVALKSAPGHEVTPSLVNSLRHVVANMVPDLKPADITILDMARGHAFHGERVDDPSADISFQRQQARIRYYEQQIQKALSHIPDVGVAVQLEPVHDAQVHAIASKADTRIDFDSLANRALPVAETDKHAAAFRGSTTEESDSIASRISSNSAKSGDLRVSISIPRDYIRELSSKQASKARKASIDSESTFAEDEITATVERIVTRLIPPSSGHDAISVTFVDRVPGHSERNPQMKALEQWIARARPSQVSIGLTLAMIVLVTLGWMLRRPVGEKVPIPHVDERPDVAEPQGLPIESESESRRSSIQVVDRIAEHRDQIRLLIAGDVIAAAAIIGQTLSQIGSTANYSESARDRQAAILLLSLDQSLAADVLGKLSRDEVEQITFAIAKAENITRDEQEQVLSNFQTAFLSRPLTQPAGPETARSLLERTLEHADVEPVQENIDAQIEAGPFAFLFHRHPDEIRQLIESEHPQTIALVSSQLSPSLAAQVLAGLKADTQAEVVRRVSRLGPTDFEVLTDIASLMHERLGRIPARTGGTRKAIEILHQAGPATARSVLKSIEERDAVTSDSLKDELFSFSDLISLNDETLRIVLQHTDQIRWTVALKGVSASLRQRILGRIESPLGTALKSEMNSLGPAPLSEILVAQRQITDAIRELAIAGEIELPVRTGHHAGRATKFATAKSTHQSNARRTA